MEVEHAAAVSKLGLVYRVLRMVLAAQVQHQEPWGRPELAVQSTHERLTEGYLLCRGIRGRIRLGLGWVVYAGWKEEHIG